MKYFLPEWEKITSDKVLLNYVKGYDIELNSATPIDYSLSNTGNTHLLSPAEKIFLEQEIAKLLQKGVLEEVAHTQGEFISPVFFRPKPNGSFRMILNLKNFNQSVKYYHFKMDTLQSALLLMEQNCFMASIDLQDAYYTVPIKNSSRKYLRFMHKNKVYQYTCLPNGLASAPRIFTKLLKPVMSELRKQGYSCLSYIDDIYIQGISKEECSQAVSQALRLFQNLGFKVHPEKSVLEPSHTLTFLGFVLDSQSMTLRPKKERIEKTMKQIQTLKVKPQITVRELAQVIGLLVSLFPGIKYGPLFYRQMELVKIKCLKENRGDYEKRVTLSIGAHDEIEWWEKNLPFAYNHILEPEPHMVIETDASSLGWGAVCQKMSRKANGKWSTREKRYHINVLELLAIFFALKTLGSVMHGKHIRIMTDSTTAVAYVTAMGGTHSIECNKVSTAIWKWALSKNIWLSCYHLPGKANLKADLLSRKFNESTEWMLNQNVFHKITSLWGKPGIDLFASRLNKQTTPFVSWRPDPDALFIDAFSFSWHNYFFYAFPPFSLIGRVLQKIRQEKAQGILIFPLWTTQAWYSKVLSMIIAMPRLLPLEENLLSLPTVVKQGPHPLWHKLQLVACLISGKHSDIEVFQKTLPLSSWPHGGIQHRSNTYVIKGNGIDFAQQDRLIHFAPL